jgi:integrase
MQAKISKALVDDLKRGKLDDNIIADTEIKGFVVRRLPSGVVTYGYRYRDRKTGARRWTALGLHGAITPEEARTLAKKRAGEVADHRDPLAEAKKTRADAARTKAIATMTVAMVLDDFMTRYVRKNRLRSEYEIDRTFKKYVKPAIGSLSIYAVRRGDIVKLLDKIEDDGAPVMADRTLAHLGKAFNWHAARDENFNSPIVRGMARTKPKDRARDRALSDDEIRDVWRALDGVSAPFPAIVRTLLLTAQRRDEVTKMSWKEIDASAWTIPADRYKTGTANLVPLSAAAREIIGERPADRPRNNDFVFSATAGAKPFNGFSKAKDRVDMRIAELRVAEGRDPMPPWVLHDLRRTARSLMSRAGVYSDIAERVLGHVIPGVRGVYDRHAYEDEKRDALDRLAALIDRILKPMADNVVELRPAG